ncbi:MAG: hypothetical protein SFW65_05250 [Alphaproteobacteria bacterium]|nr:hypothetical protein [Alphaproteobacteria bacterium]
MGIPTEFNLKADSEYTLWNGQTAFSGMTAKPRQPILRAPDDKQAVAVVWNKDTKAFISVYFELIQEGDEQIAAEGTTGLRIAGTYKGSDLFIISLPGKKLPKDLRENLTQWVNDKYLWDTEGGQQIQAQRRRDRTMTIGALCIEIEKHIGKWEVTPKAPAAAPTATPTATPSARPPERTTILGGAAREIGERPLQQQSYSSDRDFDAQDIAGIPESDGLPYSGRLKQDFDRGFTFVQPDQNIPELAGRDAFLHVSAFRRSGYPDGTTLRGGARIRFSLWDNAGKIQIDELEIAGQPRPRAAAEQVVERAVERDPRSLPPIADYDASAEAHQGESFERREGQKVVIREIPIRTPFGTEVIPGGAWRTVRGDRDPN